MIQVRDVLCPTDFSPCSRLALDHATTLATRFGATVHALHVVPAEPPPVAPVEPPVPPPLRSPRSGDAGTLQEEIDRFVAPSRQAGVRVETGVSQGDPVPAILEHADAVAPDLLVMGTHGRSGLKRLVLGSVAESVLRQARSPVLTVRAESVAAPGLGSVLCAVDFSESSHRALRWAVGLSARMGARLEVLHVIVPRPDLPYLVGLEDAEHGALLRKQAHVMLGRSVSEIVDDAGPDRVPPIDRAVLRGHPGREIVGLARREDMDLIVMGIHGHGVVDRALFGSTVDLVVRTASCPVLSVRDRLGPRERRQTDQAAATAGAR